MTLTDRHLDELKRELWRDLPGETARWSRLFDTDGRAVAAAAAKALQINDRRTILAIGEAAIARGKLDYRPLWKTGFAGALLHVLVEEGRNLQALEVNDGLSLLGGLGAGHLVLKARALAGLKRLKEARRALVAALGQDPEVRGGQELLGLIDAYGELKPRLASGDVGWGDLRRLADAYLGLGLAGRAAKAVRERAPELPAPAKADYEDALALLQATSAWLDPQFVLRQTPRLRPAAQDDRLKALAAEALIAVGRPEEALGPDQGGRDLRLQRALACAAAGDLEEGIRRLGLLSQKTRRDLEVRAALACLAGVHLLNQAPLQLRPAGGPRRIFNLVPFNDELVLLKMHLSEMADWVDLFVIVESEVTFTGASKPLHFQDHRREFAAWAGKIRHVVVPEHPQAFHSPWGRDFRQRDLAVTAISGLAAPEDLVLLTDVDEIVERRALEGFDAEFACLHMATFRYFLNYRPDAQHMPVRRTGAVWKARQLQSFGSSYARFALARRKDGPMIDNAGWHFTSICDAERLVAKMNSYAHQEHRAAWRDLDEVDRRLAAIRSGQWQKGWERAEIDDALPAYVRERRDELADLLI
jgi:hypothetical protein